MPISEDDLYLELAAVISADLGINLAIYKSPQLKRRLQIMRIRSGYPTTDAMLAAVRTGHLSAQAIVDGLSINVTDFYRDPSIWGFLRRNVFPSLSACEHLNFWSAGCASGEEVWTLAACLLEAPATLSWHIDGTDVDHGALNLARAANYPSRVPGKPFLPDELARMVFVDPAASPLHVRPDVYQRVRFHCRDLLASPPSPPYQMILCRNVLIYFTESARQQAIHSLCAALSPGGILVLGAAEVLLSADKLGMNLLCHCVYSKI